MIKPFSLTEQVLFNTVRIEAELVNGGISTGTGFFFNFTVDDKRIIPAIITNKHVIKDALTGKFQLHEAKSIDGQSMPSGAFFTVELDQFMSRWIPHPDDNVDLCAMFFQPIREEAERLKKTIYHISLDDKLIVTDTALEELSAVEEILMIGYPIGLWDEVNNLPLIRRGITATHPSVNFRGSSVGVIDAACFPGSSGSPVLILNEGMFVTKAGAVIGEHRKVLLGVLYAGPLMTAEGQIVVQAIPTSNHSISITRLRIHLGYIVKAKEILVLGEHIKQILKKNGELHAGSGLQPEP